MDDLPPGLYRLTCDLDNPEGDGRRRDYFRKPKWQKGDRFLVCPSDVVPAMRVIHPLSGQRGPSLPLRSRFDRCKAQLDVLLPHLVAEDESLDSILLVGHVTKSQVFDKLLEAGRLTLDDVRVVVAQIAARRTP